MMERGLQCGKERGSGCSGTREAREHEHAAGQYPTSCCEGRKCCVVFQTLPLVRVRHVAFTTDRKCRIEVNKIRSQRILRRNAVLKINAI
jgi:hypothetical protein